MSYNVVFAYNATIEPNDTSTESLFTNRQADSKSILLEGMEKYYSLFLVIFGTIGNGLSLAVLSRKTFRCSPIGIYLRWLALSDLTALYTGCVYFSAKALFNYDIRSASAFSCRFHRWISYTSVDMSSWILILVTVARLISILYPLRTVCTKIVAYVAIFVTLASALSANLPMFLFYGNMQRRSNGVVTCKYFPEYRFFIKNVWHWIVMVKFAVLPVGILIILNSVLCMRVFRSSDQMRKLNNSSFTEKSCKRTTSQKLQDKIVRWRERRSTKHAKKYPTHQYNISNTDLTKVTTTGELVTSLLVSNEEMCRRSTAVHSPNASTEDLRKELNEAYTSKPAASNAFLKSPLIPDTSASNSSEEGNVRNQGNAFIRFARELLDKKILHKKSKYIVSQGISEDGNNLEGNYTLRETRPLSTRSDGVAFETSRNYQSLCYDSRNSFHSARDSLQYTKEKNRKLAVSQHEHENLISEPNDSAYYSGYVVENKHAINHENNTTCNTSSDLNRPTPIFTISSANGRTTSHNGVLSDFDSSAEMSDTSCYAHSDKSKSLATSVHECPVGCILSEESDSDNDERLDEDRQILENYRESENSRILNHRNEECTVSNTISRETDYSSIDVTNNLRAASIKLQHLSLNPDTQPTTDIPLQTIPNKNRLSKNYESQQDDAASDSSRRSTCLLTNYNSNACKRSSPGKISPSIVSNGLLTPRRRDSQISSSRQSLNVAPVRPRTSGKAKSRNLTVTLLVINLVFIICNIPIAVYMTTRAYIFKERGVNSPGYTMEIISNYTMYTNNAINFILYCLTGTRFRVELKAMLRDAVDLICRRKRKRQDIRNDLSVSRYR